MERDYDFKAIEARWMKSWRESKANAAPDFPSGKKRYALTMFPYPSGDLHMGHVEVFSIHDSLARFWRRNGYEVMSPIGWDAFGLPAENAAIKRGIHPKTWTYDNIAKHRASMERLGFSFDWDRIFYTCEPAYYRWNQWFFLRFYEKGLAYRRAAPANWCPNDKTVLANEQVVAGKCERCGAVVEKRWLTQWFFKITDYAESLVADLELNTGWSDHLKTLQRNWIGRSEGAEVTFEIPDVDEKVVVFTTRPDTLWGATFFALAPEHPLAEKMAAAGGKADELERFRGDVGKLSDIDRASTEREKTGIFLGVHAVNPVNGERIPVWAADYILMDYGTGAIMAVPGHDDRDFEFAQKYGLEITKVVEAESGDTVLPYVGPGHLVNSGPFDGTSVTESARVVTEWLDEQGLGKAAVNFRLRDWLISRQRYWGTPIPVIHCDACGEVPVPDDQLPVELPDVVDFMPKDEASPLAAAEEWVNVDCPRCGGRARRETDTMDTFVDSAWYFHRYLDPHNEEIPFDPAREKAWMPVDLYSGGIEHAVLHLIYARFWQKVLVDMGMADAPEPFPAVLNQGSVTMGGKRMSKSRGNVVEPQEAFEHYGADALRLYMLFSGPPEADFDWPEEGVTAIGRVTFPWLRRVWRLCEGNRDVVSVGELHSGPAENALRKQIHKTIKVVTADYESRSFNTAIARLMELVNNAGRYKTVGGGHPAVMRELIETLLKLLAPMAPYVTEEQWHRLGHDTSIHREPWPVYDPQLAADEETTMVVQVNGKVRDTITVPLDVDEETMKELALASEKVAGHLGGNPPAKIIVKPPKLVSLVVAR